MVIYESGHAPHQRSSPAPQPPATTPRALRRWNAQLVLDALRDSTAVRVADLVERTGLSRPTVNAAADELVALGLVAEQAPDAGEEPRRGRPGRRLAFRADRGFVLGLDIGELSVRAAIADLRGDVLVERRHAFADTRRGGTHRLAGIAEVVDAVLAAARVPRERLLSAGIGVSGGIDPGSRTVSYSGALPSGVDLAAALSLPCPAHVDNDANLAALGELWQGSARGRRDVVCVLAGERLGAGLVVEGRLVRGHQGAAGEMAFLGPFAEASGAEGIAFHTRRLGVEALRESLRDGNGDGTADGTGDGTGNGAGRADDAGPGTLAARTGGDPARLDASTVFAAAADGDPVALDVVERAVDMPARAAAAIALVLDPEMVVVGGGVARAGETLLAPFRRRMEQLTRNPPHVTVSPLAERGALVGAIRFALDQLEPRLLEPLGGDIPVRDGDRRIGLPTA